MHARVTHLATGSSSLWLDGRQFGNQRLRQLRYIAMSQVIWPGVLRKVLIHGNCESLGSSCADFCTSFLGHFGWDCVFCGYHTRRLPAFLQAAARIHWDREKRTWVVV